VVTKKNDPAERTGGADAAPLGIEEAKGWGEADSLAEENREGEGKWGRTEGPVKVNWQNSSGAAKPENPAREDAAFAGRKGKRDCSGWSDRGRQGNLKSCPRQRKRSLRKKSGSWRRRVTSNHACSLGRGCGA